MTDWVSIFHKKTQNHFVDFIVVFRKEAKQRVKPKSNPENIFNTICHFVIFRKVQVFFIFSEKTQNHFVSPRQSLQFGFIYTWMSMSWKPRFLQIVSKKSALISHEDRKWLQGSTEWFWFFLDISTWNFQEKMLQIGLSVFLEINIKPFTESTVWFAVFVDQNWMSTFQKPRSLQIGF